MDINSHKKIRKIAWIATALATVFLLMDMFIFQGLGFAVDLFMFALGLAMSIDGLYSYRIKHMPYYGIALKGVWAQVASLIIILVGITLAFSGLSELF
ncbi:MAG: hypothetical protein ACI9QC_000345 [Oceanicoccus sp.]|jgi:hypothetical protein